MKKNISIIALLACSLNGVYFSMDISKTTKETIDPVLIKDTLTYIKPLLGTMELRMDPKNFLYRSCIIGFYTDTPPHALINLWKQSFDPFTAQFYVRFCPTIIRYNTGGNFENLGLLNREKHREAKEACRLGKAIFFPHKQGAIIYNLSHQIQRDDIIWKDITQKTEEICGAIDNNLTQPVAISNGTFSQH